MDISLSKFKPQPLNVIVADKFKVVEVLILRLITLEDTNWFSYNFADNEDENNGVEALSKMLSDKTEDGVREPLFTVIWRLSKGWEDKKFSEFFDKFKDVQNIIGIFFEALTKITIRSKPVEYDIDRMGKGEKKSLPIGL